MWSPLWPLREALFLGLASRSGDHRQGGAQGDLVWKVMWVRGGQRHPKEGQ